MPSAQRRDFASPNLLCDPRRHIVPPLHSVRLGVKGVQPAVPHLDRLGVDLDAVVDVLEGVVPAVPEVLAVALALPGPAEAKLFVCSRLQLPLGV